MNFTLPIVGFIVELLSVKLLLLVVVVVVVVVVNVGDSIGFFGICPSCIAVSPAPAIGNLNIFDFIGLLGLCGDDEGAARLFIIHE